MKPKNNEELKKLVKNNVLDCKEEDLICDFNIDIDADIINAWDIKAWDINALDINSGDIKARDIKARGIKAWNINALDIKAMNINALDIKAWDIKARNISYHAICFAYKNIICKSIKGRRENAKHFCLDGKIKIKR